MDDPLRRPQVRGESFTGQTWRRAKLTDWTLIGASFVDCRFENVTVSALDIHPRGGQTVFRDCEFVDCRLRPHGPGGAGVVGDALFERCRFTGGWWKGWICLRVELVDCVFALRMDNVSINADLSDPLWREDTGRSRNRVEGNDFSAARLHNFALRGGVDVRSQRWNPDEHLAIPRAADTVVAARAVVDRDWTGEERRLALNRLEIWSEYIAAGQHDLLVVPADLKTPALADLLAKSV